MEVNIFYNLSCRVFTWPKEKAIIRHVQRIESGYHGMNAAGWLYWGTGLWEESRSYAVDCDRVANPMPMDSMQA